MLSPNARNRVALRRSGVVTVTVNVQESLFPLASAATTVTVVSPSGKIEPETGSDVTTGALSHASVAAGNANVAVALLLEVQTLTFASGHTMLGAVVSTTFSVRVTSMAALAEGSVTL